LRILRHVRERKDGCFCTFNDFNTFAQLSFPSLPQISTSFSQSCLSKRPFFSRASFPTRKAAIIFCCVLLCAVQDAQCNTEESPQATFLSHGRQPKVSFFFYLTCVHTTTLILFSIFSLVQTISSKSLERLISWHAKYPRFPSVAPACTRVFCSFVCLSPKLGTTRNLQSNVRDTQGERERNISGEVKEQLETNSELQEGMKPTAMA